MKLIADADGAATVSTLLPQFDHWPSTAQASLRADEFHLALRDAGLALCRGAEDPGVSVSGRDVERRLRGDFLLARACGVQRGSGLTIVDATAGLGVDTFALARLGVQVLAVERHVALWALLWEARQRLGAANVELRHADARAVLGERSPGSVDVVYLDPMFPERRKKALPGKAMQYLRALLPEDADPLEPLLAAARRVAGDRVVVKRRRRDPLSVEPDWQILGTSVRYDVYRGA